MTGLWVAPNQYLNFAEIERQPLMDELASRSSSWDYAGTMGLLPDPDPVLLKLADGGVSVLENLTADGHVISAIQQRKLGTLKKEFSWSAGGDAGTAAKKLAADLAVDLERVDLYTLISGLLDAPFYGNTPVEIIWEATGGRMRIKDLVVKPSRWFAYDENNVLKFKSQSNPWAGTDLPFGKFIISRHFPTYDNPYGLRLLSRCLWPVAFKKGGIKFWVQLAEKFGTPFLVGKYGQGTTPAQQQTMLSNLASMVQSAVAVLPENSSVQILEGAQKASSEIHSSLKSAMDAEISKVLMGQTLTAEVGDKGSYAAGKVHQDVLEDFRLADQRLVKTAMEEIAWLYGLINAPGVAPPIFTWFEEDEPKKDFAERDKTLSETGVKFLPIYYVRKYGLKEDEFEVVGQPPPGPLGPQGSPLLKGGDKPGAPVLFSEHSCPHCAAAFAEGKPDIVAQVTATIDSAPHESSMVEKIAGLVKGAKSLEEIRDNLAGLYDGPATQGLGKELAKAMILANLAGRYEVLDEVSLDFAEPGFLQLDFNQPFDLQIEFFRSKLNLPTERFDDLWKDEHAKAFMIAGAVEAEMLSDFRTAVDSAISGGDTLETFQKSFDTIVAKYGWSYNGSRDWRSNLIYKINIRTAYMAGRWQQHLDPELLGIYPYLEYGRSSSRNPREAHQPWYGTILPANDPWWSTHYPPNDWGCECPVYSVGPRDLKRLGKSAPDKAPTSVDDMTGMGEGWDYNVGMASNKSYELLSDQLDRMPADIAKSFIAYLVGDAAFDTVATAIKAAIGGK